MASLMLVNPKGQKPKRKTKAKANPRPRKRRARANPAHKRRRSRRNPVAIANPARKRRRARRNPKFSVRSIQRDAIMPAIAGGVGALALDIAFGALPIPATFKTGAVGSLAKIAGAVILGKLAGKAFGAKVGQAVTVGGVTIQAYNTVKAFAQKQMPTLPMGEYLSGDFPAYSQMGYTTAAPSFGENLLSYQPGNYGSSEMGAYLSADDAENTGAYGY